MPDDQNTIQNPIPEENPISKDIGVNIGSSIQDTTPEAINAPTAVSTPEMVNNTAPENTQNKAEIAENGQNTENTLENQVPGIEPNPEPVSEPIPETIQTPEPRTAQIPPSEPLNNGSEPVNSEPVSVSNYGEAKAEPENINPVPVIIPNKNKVLELLNKAKLAIQYRKRKKLDKIMTLFLKHPKITNDEVEKFLHVSDATAERYLNILEKENKIKQIGKTGHAVSYTKI
ncbi:MAG: hypothetical protein WCI93_02660 [bacterium]